MRHATTYHRVEAFEVVVAEASAEHKTCAGLRAQAERRSKIVVRV
jgi:hypothetical protein